MNAPEIIVFLRTLEATQEPPSAHERHTAVCISLEKNRRQAWLQCDILITFSFMLGRVISLAQYLLCSSVYADSQEMKFPNRKALSQNTYAGPAVPARLTSPYVKSRLSSH